MGKKKNKEEDRTNRKYFQERVKCECMALQHNLINNCLSCGRVVCEKEGEGPCFFCSTVVLRSNSTYVNFEDEGLFPTLKNQHDKAVKHRDHLVSKDTDDAPRQNIYDQQTDYYEIAENKWADQEHREFAVKRLAEEGKLAKDQMLKNRGYYDPVTGQWIHVAKEFGGQDFKKQAQEYILSMQSKKLAKKMETFKGRDSSMKMQADVRLSNELRDMFRAPKVAVSNQVPQYRVSQTRVQLDIQPVLDQQT